MAGYKSYAETAASENPEAPFDPDRQVTPDLTGKGVELAREKAEEFFARLNPETDTLFFVSSNEARAVETADVYRQVAHEKGFEVIRPDNSRSELSDRLAEGEIRILDNLSINSKNTVANAVFSPEAQRPKINWEVLSDESRQKWEEATAIVDTEDKGSWGANFHAYSDAVKKIYPEVDTTQELYEKNFQNLVRLLKWGIAKAEEGGMERAVKILAFGHENYLMTAFEEYFQEHGIRNCETMRVGIEDGKVKAEYRGKEADLSA